MVVGFPRCSLPCSLKAWFTFEPGARLEASKAQQPLASSLCSAGFTGIHVHTWLLYVGAGIQTQVFMFTQQVLYPPGQLSAPSPLFYSKL